MRTLTLKKIMSAIFVIFLLMTLVSNGCEDGGNGITNPDFADSLRTGTFKDKRDGNVYRWVRIGDLIWMAENLNYKKLDGTGSWCFRDSAVSCDRYGRLYNWTTAMAIDTAYLNALWGREANHRGICPSGWRMPSNRDWDDLVTATGDSRTAGTKLKSETGWVEYENIPAGTDEFGFSALPGSRRDHKAYYYYSSRYSYWWTSTEYQEDFARHRLIDYRNEMVGSHWNYRKNNGMYVRCVRP